MKLIICFSRCRPKYFKTILPLAMLAILVGCNTFGQYRGIKGVTLIQSLGNPPAENLVWSPKDMNSILVTASDVGPGRAQIYTLNTITKKKQTLVTTQYGNLIAESWAPDGKSMIFAADPGTRGFERGGSWIFNLDNSSLTFLNGPGLFVWSPDGKTIASLTFIRTTGSGSRGINIHLIDVVTGEDKIIYTDETASWFFGLSWSPDDRYLTFSLGNIGDSNIYMLDTMTGEEIQLTSEHAGSSYPVWSPKGKLIVYEKKYYVQNDLYSSMNLIDVDKRCEVTLPRINFAQSATWSPDGTKLAFIGLDGIYSVDLNEFIGKDVYQNLCN